MNELQKRSSFAWVFKAAEWLSNILVLGLIPLIAWLVTMRSDVSAHSSEFAEIKIRLSQHDAAIAGVQVSVDNKFDTILSQLGDLKEQVGGVKGELKRIKR